MLAAAARRADPDFASAAWKLAEVLGPVGSAPLEYVLDPMNIRRYGDALNLQAVKKLITRPKRERSLWRMVALSGLDCAGPALRDLVRNAVAP